MKKTDEEIVSAFRLFLEGVGGPARPGLKVKDRQKVLAALDVLDPEFGEQLSERWAWADSGECAHCAAYPEHPCALHLDRRTDV